MPFRVASAYAVWLRRCVCLLACLFVVNAMSCGIPHFEFQNGQGGSGGTSTDGGVIPGPHCSDGQLNNGESDVDCGGECTACASGLACVSGDDCQSHVCTDSVCAQPTCADGVLNGDETERDCGGSTCSACDPGQSCKVGTDCSSNTCTAGTCALVCVDGTGDCDGDIKNGCETNFKTDATACGGCGMPCLLPHAEPNCLGGKCGVSKCTAPYEDCDGDPSNGCETNTRTDPVNCGGCGKACVDTNGTPSCSGGACQITCNTGFDDCDDDRANGCEKDTTRDVNNCGGCGKICDAKNGTPFCKAGVCGISNCPAGFGDCNGDPADGCETDLTADGNNCKTCGNVCKVANGSAACVASACKLTACDPGHADCNAGTTNGYTDGCEVTTTTDSNNCGKCGTVCNIANANAKCDTGTCKVKTCVAPFADCDGSGLACATNTNTNGSNCGGCGTSCAGAFAHASGKCVTGGCQIDTCAGSYLNCNKMDADGCESDKTSDNNNCGGCGTVCKAPHGTNSCVSSACSPSCGTQFANCDGVLPNGCSTVLASDKKNCGSCNNTCLDINTTSNNCSGGSCQPMCNSTYQSCDKDGTNGCESNSASDSMNCGGCNIQCTNAHGSNTCSGSNCSPTCATGYKDCDGDPTNGCERPVSGDTSNCGGCNIACKLTNASATSCGSSVCKPVCNSGWDDCSNPENGCTTSLDLPANCGSCGHVCPGTSPFCIGRVCKNKLDITVVNSNVSDLVLGTSLTLSHKLGSSSGKYRLMVVGVANYGTGATTVKYNNVAMTLAKSSISGQIWGGVYYLLDSGLPATAGGTYNVTITGAMYAIVANVTEFNGVDQTTPVDASTSNSLDSSNCGTVKDTLGVVTDGAYAYDLVSVYAPAGDAGGPSGGSLQTQVLDLRSNVLGGVAGYWGPLSPGSRMMSWDVTPGCSYSASAALALRPAITP